MSFYLMTLYVRGVTSHHPLYNRGQLTAVIFDLFTIIPATALSQSRLSIFQIGQLRRLVIGNRSKNTTVSAHLLKVL